jgi:hypothetical protein
MPKHSKRKTGKIRRPTAKLNETIEREISMRPSSRDPLTVQISARVKKPKGIRLTKKVLEQAIRFKLDSPTLADPRGFTLRIVSWTNPTRNPTKTNPRNGLPLNAPRDYGPDKERWLTLRRALQSAPLDARRMGVNK